MRESVQAEVLMSFVVSEELSFRIPVELGYEGRDPFAVRMTFHLPGDAPVTWAFGRELLLDGINAPSGEGDVRIEPADGEELSDVSIRLCVGPDQAVFRASAPPLIAFLDRTDRLVPLGQESTLGDFGDDLEKALGRILAENAG
ncbi:SsgA family sporulation/cell division regulator [Streptomyces sp. MUM 203J]|uniref:SsgA family sporulation/cell division regulator n=1 Tax=Streptomyces sp. MUM 203J TaxID=2791990 RepID=UPI001F0439B8|nr:SsgA family sporulation/cell division regulator [Streptomyces sp. MUM 203J]MCH0538807.1 SsgA family sporulation/cell division regulator [Streptomyces sp. MUM 203J]